jgi:S-adenosylmethionine hydrolase
LFSKNTTDNQIKTTNTIDGFQARQSVPLLQCLFDKTLVGYENGLIVVINEADGAMLKVVDIINKQLPANKSESFHGI